MDVPRWIRFIGVVPAAAAVYAGAASPWISQRLPRFALPALAVIGGAAMVVFFVNGLVRLARGDRAEWRPHALPLLVSLVGVVFLAALPFVRFVGVMAAPREGAPLVLARFGDWFGGEGYPRLSPHRGVDIAGRVGSDVLAAAEGRVAVARDSRDLCGLIVVIVHDPHGYRTVYCHFSEIVVRPGDTVRRGQRIGAVGTTGQRAWPGYEHVHLELQRGRDPNDIEDPLPRMVGCFDEQARYQMDRIVLTYPVQCR